MHSSETGIRKFEEGWCKKLIYLTFSTNMGIASCRICSSFPIISDQNAKTVKGYTEPFNLETFKKEDKIFQNQKCKQANSASFTVFCGLQE